MLKLIDSNSHSFQRWSFLFSNFKFWLLFHPIFIHSSSNDYLEKIIVIFSDTKQAENEKLHWPHLAVIDYRKFFIFRSSTSYYYYCVCWSQNILLISFYKVETCNRIKRERIKTKNKRPRKEIKIKFYELGIMKKEKKKNIQERGTRTTFRLNEWGKYFFEV